MKKSFREALNHNCQWSQCNLVFIRGNQTSSEY
jgi:hypothetical protein